MATTYQVCIAPLSRPLQLVHHSICASGQAAHYTRNSSWVLLQAMAADEQQKTSDTAAAHSPKEPEVSLPPVALQLLLQCSRRLCLWPRVTWLLQTWALGPGARMSGLHEVCEG